MSIDQRAHARKEVSIETRLFLPTAASSDEPTLVIPCRIVDISQSGARIVINAGHKLPPRVYLFRGEDENSYECRTVRQDGKSVGLRFNELCTQTRYWELLQQMKHAQIVAN